MPRVKVGPALPDVSTLDVEIARLRDLDVASLQARLHNVFRRRPSPHLPRHLLFRVLAYRLQAERLGDLDVEVPSRKKDVDARDKRGLTGEEE